MNAQNSDFKDYLNEIHNELKTNPVRSEILPILVLGALSLLSWNKIGLLVALAALYFRFRLFIQSRRHHASQNDFHVVQIGKPALNGSGSLFTSMLNGRYVTFMRSWMYKILGLACLISSFSILALSIFLIPVTVWLFNWARAFFKIGDKEKLARKMVAAQIEPAVTPDIPVEKKPVDIPLPKTNAAYQQVYQEKIRRQTAAKAIDPFYEQAILFMENDLKALNEKENHIQLFLDELFGNSEITKSKYIKPIHSAKSVVEKNLAKVRQTIKLFGDSAPTPERMGIINNYVADAHDIVAKVDIIIDELVKIDQNQLIKSNDVLDETLNELAQTTHLYQQV